MASTEVVYVNTASSGGDGTTNATSGTNAAYASLSAAETAKRADLVTADKVMRFKCSGGIDTTQVYFALANWTTDNTRYIVVEAYDASQSAVAGGWKTDRYRLGVTDPANLAALRWSTKRVDVFGLQVRATYTTAVSGGYVIWNQTAYSAGLLHYMNGVRAHGSWALKTGSPIFRVFMQNGNVSCRMSNCIGVATSMPSGGMSEGSIITDSGAPNATCYAYNCTFIGCTNATQLSAGNGRFIFKGCSFVRNGTAATKGPDFRSGSDTNAFDESSLSNVGTNSRQGQTFAYTDAPNGDVTFGSGDTAVKGYGVDLSADSILPVTTDINGATLGTPFDIGPWKYTSGSSTSSLYETYMTNAKPVEAGTTSNIRTVYLFDATGLPVTAALLYSAVTCKSRVNGGASSSTVTLATMVAGTFVSGGFIQLDGTNEPGAFQFGVPNADVATKGQITYNFTATGGVKGALVVDVKEGDVYALPQGVIATGNATAFTGTTLSLATGQTYETDALKSSVIYIKDAATGKGQSWLILSNTNATPSVCTIDGTFAPTLTGTPFYQILAAPKYPSDYYARFANAINDDAIDVIQTYARASNLAATIDKSTGTETLTLTTDATFLPIKSVT